ncbi:MAG: phage head closure protein, partial [Bacillota bacterium]|nr:phage head closure protein [Bacillota bacterium]
EVEAWVDIGTVWASIEPLSGREFFAAQQVNAEVSTKITLRYKAGIKPEMRVLFAGRVFEILSVINLEEKNIQFVLMCKEVLGSG